MLVSPRRSSRIFQPNRRHKSKTKMIFLCFDIISQTRLYWNFSKKSGLSLKPQKTQNLQSKTGHFRVIQFAYSYVLRFFLLSKIFTPHFSKFVKISSLSFQNRLIRSNYRFELPKNANFSHKWGYTMAKMPIFGRLSHQKRQFSI